MSNPEVKAEPVQDQSEEALVYVLEALKCLQRALQVEP